MEGGRFMSVENLTYLEKQTEATLTIGEDGVEIIFQRAKLKLYDEHEIQLLKSVNPEFKKTFELTEDQLKIHMIPPDSYSSFKTIKKKSKQARWQFAYNIIQTVKKHSINRLKLFVSPDNMMFDNGLIPHFLHYGVRESIPPYEDDLDRLWLETKAVVATATDDKYEFTSFLLHNETISLSPNSKKIMRAENYDELLEVVNENLKKDENYENTVIHVPKNKWKLQRYVQIALIILLVPALIYSIFVAFFKIPEIEAYVHSNRSFLENEYSAVIDKLSPYDHENMPYVVQYQLASAYVVNESLTEVQRQNVTNTLTLQTDRNYFTYWVDIGRGDYQNAIDTARIIEDRDLMIYGLLKYREMVKADQSLSGEEREEQISSIQREIDEYEEEMKQEQVEQAEQEAEEELEREQEQEEEAVEDELNEENEDSENN